MTTSSLLEVVQIVASLIQTAAIVIAGLWAYNNFILKRGRYPRADLSLEASDFAISNSKHLLRVSATVRNGGDILLSLSRAEIWVQQVSPCPAAILDAVLNDRTRDISSTELEWPLLDERCLVRKGEKHFPGNESCIEWDKQEIEPGEMSDYHFDFVIDSRITTVIIYAHFENVKKRNLFWRLRRNQKPFGWNTTMMYTLNKQSSANLALK